MWYWCILEQILNVVQETESLKKISFLAHSLGGLFARYAIAILYNQDNLTTSHHENFINSSTRTLEKAACTSKLGKIAGLEPINFITLATPHLGVRGKKQVNFWLFKNNFLCYYHYIIYSLFEYLLLLPLFLLSFSCFFPFCQVNCAPSEWFKYFTFPSASKFSTY